MTCRSAPSMDPRTVSKAAYRVDHREEAKALAAAWRAAHPERVKTRTAAYNLLHHEERLAYNAAHRAEAKSRNAAYHAVHSEERAIAKRAYRAAHREECRASYAAYYLAHRDELRAKGWRDNAKRRGGKGCEHADCLTLGATQLAWQTNEHVCYLCGVPVQRGVNLHMDHVVPLARGGAHCAENLRPACAHCNQSKGSRVFEPGSAT